MYTMSRYIIWLVSTKNSAATEWDYIATVSSPDLLIPAVERPGLLPSKEGSTPGP